MVEWETFRSDIHYLSPESLRSFGDVTLNVWDGESGSDRRGGGSFSVNRCLIASHSPIIKKALSSILDSQDQIHIILPDFSKNEIKKLENYIFCGVLDLNDSEFSKTLSSLGINSCSKEDSSNNIKPENLVVTHLKEEEEEEEEEDYLDHDDDDDLLLNQQDEDSQNDSLLSCPFCDQSFNDDHDSYNDHLWSHFKLDDEYYCKICQRSFENDFPSVRKHVKEFHFGITLKRHYKNLSDYRCINCGSQEPLKNHRLHFPNHFPNCNYPTCAGGDFISYEEHFMHIKIEHEGIPRYHCGKCDSTFENEEERLSHRSDYHSESSKKTRKRYSKEEAAAIKYAKSMEKTVCDQCGVVQTKANMRLHLYKVHGTQPVTCEHCGKNFNHPHTLKIHINKTHRKFPCDQCGYMCRSPTAYKYHLLSSHTAAQDKPYQCETCGKGFAKKCRFEEHLNVHTGAKPYKCKYCNLAFSHSSNKYHHENTVHKGKKRIQIRKKNSSVLNAVTKNIKKHSNCTT